MAVRRLTNHPASRVKSGKLLRHPHMTTALLSHHYDPSLNHAAPLSSQHRQPRRSEAEPRWLLRPESVAGIGWTIRQARKKDLRSVTLTRLDADTP